MRKVNSVKIRSRIQKISKSYGYTQEKMAEALNCSARYVSDIEQNRSNPSYEILITFCNLFKIGMNEIFVDYLEISSFSSVNCDIMGYKELNGEDQKTIEHLIAFFNSKNN